MHLCRNPQTAINQDQLDNIATNVSAGLLDKLKLKRIFTLLDLNHFGRDHIAVEHIEDQQKFKAMDDLRNDRQIPVFVALLMFNAFGPAPFALRRCHKIGGIYRKGTAKCHTDLFQKPDPVIEASCNLLGAKPFQAVR